MESFSFCSEVNLKFSIFIGWNYLASVYWLKFKMKIIEKPVKYVQHIDVKDTALDGITKLTYTCSKSTIETMIKIAKLTIKSPDLYQ